MVAGSQMAFVIFEWGCNKLVSAVNVIFGVNLFFLWLGITVHSLENLLT